MTGTRGFDTTQDCTARAVAIRAHGYGFVCRYSSYSTWKNLTRKEALALSRVGLYIVNVWETAGDNIGYFTMEKGMQDGTDAYKFARSVGQPFNSPIYFAVDTDVADSDLHRIDFYFQGVREALRIHGEVGKSTYMVGVYGCGAVCAHVKQSGYASHTWLAYAPGWNGNSTYQDWSIRQVRNGVRVLGLSVDEDESHGAGGGFQVSP